MADCVHLRCQGLPACRWGVRTALNQEVGECVHCGLACVFTPDPPMWVGMNGHLPDDERVNCHKSPTNKHWVR